MRTTALICVCMAALSWAPPVEAGVPASTPAALPQQADADNAPPRLGIHASYGFAAELNGSVAIDVATLSFRWTGPVRGFHPFGAESSWGFEGTLFAFDREPVTPGFGGHVLYELRAPGATLRPLFRLGVGALASTRRVPPGETRHNFSLHAGVGLEILLDDAGRRLEIGYRLHHVSNADTGTRNLGINTHAVVLGLSWDAGP